MISRDQIISVKFLAIPYIDQGIKIYANSMRLEWNQGEWTEEFPHKGCYEIPIHKNGKGKTELLIYGSNIRFFIADRLCITDLSFTHCEALELISCSANEIIHLDLTQCPLLQELNGNSNNLTEIHAARLGCLRKLNLSYNQLDQLDCEDCVNLMSLNCSDNNVQQLNLKGCNNLKYINLTNNNLERKNLEQIVNILPYRDENEYACIYMYNNPGFDLHLHKKAYTMGWRKAMMLCQ